MTDCGPTTSYAEGLPARSKDALRLGVVVVTVSSNLSCATVGRGLYASNLAAALLTSGPVVDVPFEII